MILRQMQKYNKMCERDEDINRDKYANAAAVCIHTSKYKCYDNNLCVTDLLLQESTYCCRRTESVQQPWCLFTSVAISTTSTTDALVNI